MNFSIPNDLKDYLASLDTFIDEKIIPLQMKDDNDRFFDYRREHARTDWDNKGLPRKEWEDLLSESRRIADEAGFFRFSLPRQYGGQNSPDGRGCNLWMAVIREHLAAKGLGLFNDLQTEHSIVGNFPDIIMLLHFGTEQQQAELIPRRLAGSFRMTFGLTEPDHGSDATHMATRGVVEIRNGIEGWVLNGMKKWQTGMHHATHCAIFARTAGNDGDVYGISCFVVPVETPGLKIESYEWTLNMPTDHATISLTNLWIPHTALLSTPHNGLQVAQSFVHENRLRQAASSLGAATFCLQSSIKHAQSRRPFNTPLSHNQAIQFPLVELSTQASMLRLLIRKTALALDNLPAPTSAPTSTRVDRALGGEISMCNFVANRLCTSAADLAIQIHGAMGYSRHQPFEHIWRHHRRYRITEGSEEIQMRKVAAFLFGFGGRKMADEEGERMDGDGEEESASARRRAKL